MNVPLLCALQYNERRILKGVKKGWTSYNQGHRKADMIMPHSLDTPSPCEHLLPKNQKLSKALRA